MRSGTYARIVVLFVGALFVACTPAVTVVPPEPVPVRVAVVAQEGVNPDRSGRASPIVLRIYQLSADGEFLAADYFSLYQNEATVLPRTLLAREERVISPGESQSLDLALKPETKFLGVLAGFRDVEQSTWRAITPIHGSSLAVALSANAVVLKLSP